MIQKASQLKFDRQFGTFPLKLEDKLTILKNI